MEALELKKKKKTLWKHIIPSQQNIKGDSLWKKEGQGETHPGDCSISVVTCLSYTEK